MVLRIGSTYLHHWGMVGRNEKEYNLRKELGAGPRLEEDSMRKSALEKSPMRLERF